MKKQKLTFLPVFSNEARFSVFDMVVTCRSVLLERLLLFLGSFEDIE